MRDRRFPGLLGVFLIVGCVVLAGGVIGAATDGSTGPGASGPAEQGGTALSSLQETSSEEESLGPNLLDNPQCIVDEQEKGEEPLYWTVEQGELECNEPEPQFMPDPIEGEYVFIDWEDLEPTTDESIATQTVPVTGGSEYQFSVWVGSDEVEDDYAQFEVQFLDDGTLIDDGMIDSGEFQPEDHTEPDQYVETTEAPENADEAVVRIILVNGGDFDLDRPLLWADDVRLQEFSDAPTAFDVEGVETGIEQTLAPDWTLFDDEFGEDEDDRGFDDDAEISHFGGGDLSGSVTDNAAGETVGLAGGDLQVNADGSFSVTNPTQTGTFAFEYRLGYEGDHDDATVEIEISDHELESPKCEEWDDNEQDRPLGWDKEGGLSCYDPEDLPFTDSDHTAVGDRSFTDNYILIDDDETDTHQTVYVVGGETYTVSGLYGTDSDDYSGEVEFEYLDSDGDVIANEGFTLEELQSESTTDFDRFTETTDAPDDAKRATLRLTVVRPSGHQDPAGVYFDDLSIERGDPGEEPVNARDVETEVGIYHTFEPSDTLFDDWGNGVDELGTPEADFVNFGGGDLSGSVTDHGPGDEVPFAGGTLTVEADGSFSLEEPTDVGTHTFEYEIENEHDSSTATVEIWVRDSTLLDADCDPDTFEVWDDVSPGNGNIDCLDPQESGTAQPNGQQNPPVPPYAIGDRGGDGYDAVGEQAVPVRGGYTYELAGFVGTEATPEDSYVTLEVDYLDEDGTELTVSGGDDLDLSEMRSEGTTEFDAFSDTTVPPEDATHATVRIFIHSPEEMDLGGDAYARAYVDDLSFDLLGTPPEANDADLEVDAADTLTASVLSDHGHGADALGEPDAEVVSFGGGDLAGDATEYDAGETTALAGGDLTIESDGSLEFVAPTEPGTVAFDYRLENDAGYDEATVTIEVESLTVDGTVTDAVAAGEPGIADATVTLDHEDSEESYETETASDGSYELAVGQVGEFVLTVKASGYEMKSAPITLDGGDETRDVGLTGNASVSGTVSDTTFETGLEGIEVAVENGLGAYTAETDEDGEYTVESVPGTGEEYAVTVDPTGWDGNSTTVTIDDSDDVTDVDFEITGDAKDSIALSDWKTGEPLEGATVRIEHETFGVAEDAFTADGDGEMEIVLPGGFTYEYTFSHPGYDPAEIPLRSFDPGHELSANYVLGGNAEIDGKITDAETGGGIGGATVTAQNGAGAYEATTSADGSYTIENVPGGHDYDVTIEADGYETVVESDESVGDEATHTLDSGLTGTAAIEGTVEDERTGVGLENADVTVVYPDAHEFTVEAATDADGAFTIETVPGTDEEYTVVAQAAGYEAGDTTVTVGDGALANAGAIELAGNAAVSGTVEDATFESGVPDVEVTVSDGQAEYTATTDENGEYTVENVPGTGAEYTVRTDPVGWYGESRDESIGDGVELTDVDFVLTGNASAEFEVGDLLTGTDLEGASVTIEHETFGAVTELTNESGYVSFAVPADQHHEYTISKAGYEEPYGSFTLQEGGYFKGVRFLAGTGTLSGQISDTVTGEPIEDADLVLEYPSGEAVAFEAATDADGEYTIEDVPGTDDEYTVHASADGYHSNATTTVVGDEENVEDVTVGLNGTASVSGAVSDTTFETGIGGIEVAVENGLGTYTAETDENGEYTVESIPGTGESYTVSVDPTGWDGDSTTVTIDDGDDVTGVDLEITGDARDSITLSDWETGTPLEGATVRIEHETFGVAEDAFTADGDGEMEIVLPGGFTYEYTFSQPGYDPAVIPQRSFDPGDGMSANYVLGGNAEIDGQITDAETGGGIGGATVTAQNGAGAYEATTSADGSYTIENVPGGHDYDVTIDADGYETVVESDEAVGDEATHTLDSELAGNAAIEGTVEDANTGDGIENADVTVVYPSGGEFTVEAATDADGAFTIEAVPGTDEEYTVVARAAGYEAGDTTVTVGDGALANAGAIELAGNAVVSGTVEDATFESGVPDVEVTVSDGQVEYTATTDENGEYTVENVPGTGEGYDVAVDPVGWGGDSVIESVGDGAEVADVNFELTGTATDEVTVTDGVTDAELEGVTVTIDHATFGTVDKATDANGEAWFAVPGDQSYDYTISTAGYEEVEQSRSFGPEESKAIELSLVGTAELHGQVVDATTGEPIEGAALVLEYPSGEPASVEAASDADGAYAIEDVPGTGETYEISASADGYDANATTATVGDEETVEDVRIELAGSATVSGTVSDTTFETGLEGLEVAVSGQQGEYTAETDENGEYAVEGVAGTGEEYTVTVDPTGWDGESTIETVGDGVDMTGVDLEVTGDASNEVTLRDAETDAPLEGGTMTIEHETFGVAEDVATADENGYATVDVPGGFDYEFTYSNEGYDEFVVPYSFDPGEEATGTHVLSGNAELTGQITDSESGDGVEGATVTAENGAGAYDATTSSDGTYTIENVPGGHDYDVAIDADGYETVVESDESVGDGATHTLDGELTGTATLGGTVTDETFGTGLDGVEVDVAGEQEYVVETDENGEYTAAVAGTGEEYTVTVDPDGWVEASESVELGDGETETGVDFELAGDATIELTVEDAETGGPIDGATVIVTNGTLGESDSFESDGDGMVELAPLPGGFTYDFTIEADGYDGDELADVSLTEDASESRTHGLFGNAEITGQVTDEVTGGPIDGATVTAENGAGTYEAATDENGAYTIENVPGGHGYDLTADATGYEPLEANVTVGDGAVETADLSIAGDAELTGEVVDALTGDGIEGVTVRAENGAGTYDATTDETGEYTITNLPGGEAYELVADHADYEPTTRSDVTVDAGTHRTENLALEPIGEATVVGTVADELTGEPIAGAAVTLEIDDGAVEGEAIHEAETDGEGRYEVEEVVGAYEYTVTVEREGYEPASATELIDGDGTTTVDLTATGNASVSGTVERETNGDGIADATITVSGAQGEYTAQTNASGAFTVEGVAGTGDEYEVSASASGYATNATSLEVGDGETVEDVVIELSRVTIPLPPGEASLAGTVIEAGTGDPIEGATVEVAETGEQVRTGADGTYAFELPPRGYTLIASADGFQDHERTVQLSSSGTTLELVLEVEPDYARYADDDGIVRTDGLREAIGDWREDVIDTDLLRDVIDAWRSGDPVG